MEDDRVVMRSIYQEAADKEGWSVLTARASC